jgi:ribosomal protein S1
MKPAETLKVTYVTGEVKAVDTVAKTITVVKKVVRGKEEETVVTVDEKTTITKGKAKKMLADVKVGNNVTVKYTEVEGKNVAKSVAIKAAKKKAAKKK